MTLSPSQLKESVRIVASRAKGIEDIRKSGKLWVSWMLENGMLKPGMKVLDFGAGVGRLSVPMAEAGAQVTAIDRRDDMITYLTSCGVECFQSEDALPVMGKSFDFAIATYVFQHMGRLRARHIIEQIGLVTDKLYFTIPVISYWEGKAMPPSYHPEIGQSGWEEHGESERSYVYADDQILERLLLPFFSKLSKVELKGAGLFLAEK